ncbi:hypothetical protein M422DRAFT_30024, partial [Sphaerobolus stellatus SS14]
MSNYPPHPPAGFLFPGSPQGIWYELASPGGYPPPAGNHFLPAGGYPPPPGPAPPFPTPTFPTPSYPSPYGPSPGSISPL